MTACETCIIKIRQNDDSDFAGNKIIFHLRTQLDVSKWKARFRLQNITWMCDVINDNEIELIISKEQSNIMQPGKCYGWLQLIDTEGKQGTVYKQQFQILQREVY